MGGRAAAAAYYPIGLITAILRGMRNTADAEEKEVLQPVEMTAAMDIAGALHDVPCTSIRAAMASQDVVKMVATKEFPVKFGDGTQKLVRPNGNFKPQ